MLGEIGLPQLPAHIVARLRELATQGRRIVYSGHVQAFIRDDDQFCATIRELIDENAKPSTGHHPPCHEPVLERRFDTGRYRHLNRHQAHRLAREQAEYLWQQQRQYGRN